MSTPTQIVPTLTILEDEGEFTVRVGGQENAAGLAQAIVPLLAKLGARKLLIITPMDTKVYKFDSSAEARSQESPPAIDLTPKKRVIADSGAPPTAEAADEEYARYQREEAEAERIAAEQAATSGTDPQLPEEEAAPIARTKSKARVLPTQNPCGRCQGGGTLEGGGVCPVCHGKGQISQWGRKARG
jgi:hypothetical protein